MKALEAKHRKLERSDNTDSNQGQGNKNKPKDKTSMSKTQSKDTKCARTAVVQIMHQKTVGSAQRTRAKLNLVKSFRTKRS